MAIAKFFAAIASGKSFTLFGDGTTRRDYTYIDDIVSGTVAAIERIRPGEFEIFNIGGTRTTALADLVSSIERISGRKAIIEARPAELGDVPLTFANIERAKEALGYSPVTPVELGLEQYWTWLRATESL